MRDCLIVITWSLKCLMTSGCVFQIGGGISDRGAMVKEFCVVYRGSEKTIGGG